MLLASKFIKLFWISIKEYLKSNIHIEKILAHKSKNSVYGVINIIFINLRERLVENNIS